MRKMLVVLSVLALMLHGTLAFAVDFEDVTAKQGMVSSAHELASKAGVEMMEKGGNAVDAAVATAMVLSLVEPTMSGPGGGGFMVIRLAETGETVVLDYRETAPASATKDMFASEESKEKKWSMYGGKSVAVPGWLMGMWTALEEYGTMSWSDVAQPAIRIANEGYTVSAEQHRFIAWLFMSMLDYNDPDDLPFFKDGGPVQAGDHLAVPKLGEFYRLVGEKGPSVMYGGEVGEAIVRSVNEAGGSMTIEDMKNYTLKRREPIVGTYKGYTIYSMPPCSSGGTHIVQLLNIMENYPVDSWKYHSAEHIHFLAEGMKQIFADRGKFMADTDFVQVPIDGLINKEYAKQLVGTFPADTARQEIPAGDPWPFAKEPKAAYDGGTEPGFFSTSHFSVVDAHGNIVASTNSLNYSSGVVAREYSMPLNNHMDDFSSNPESVNAPEPGKRPLSSMSPTVLTDPDGKPFMTLGSAGGWRIITAVSQIIMNVIDFGMSMDEAIEKPRIFTFSMNGQAGPLRCEVLDEDVQKALEAKGHKIEVQGKGDYYGTSQGIMIKDGVMYGGADSRRLGVAVGF